jgi:nicotinamidase-related amidase
MIWPYHTMQGTIGNALAAPVSEALAWHSAARNAQPNYIVKGLTLRTEFYGIFGAEITDPEDAASKLSVGLMDTIMQYDRVYIAGEAKSHCVLETVRQLVGHFAQQPEMLRKIHFLRDCTSSVQHPTIDFESIAEAELQLVEKMGVHMVSSQIQL